MAFLFAGYRPVCLCAWKSEAYRMFFITGNIDSFEQSVLWDCSNGILIKKKEIEVRTEEKRDMKKNMGFLMVLMLLTVLTGCSVSGIAKNVPRRTVQEDPQYAVLEDSYLKQVRGILKDAGLKDAGVMLTHVTEEDGSRIYTLSVHHRGFSWLEDAEMERLSASLRECAFSGEDCSFVQNFT